MISTRARLAAAALPLALGAVTLLPLSSAAAPSASLVISEAYGGGGNSGAPLRSDFVELFNRGSAAVDLTGWSLQYWSAGGASPQRTDLSGSIAPDRHFLVQQATGANTAAPELPTPDATGTVAMSSSGARVAVVDPSGAVVDLLGWGAGAATFEGAPAAGTANATSVARRDPCVDTDDNATDFVVGAPTPLNAAAPARQCTAAPPAPELPTATIPQIQGRTHVSPYAGKAVRGVAGIVTAVGPRGFWLQSATPDDDPATSEGLYAYTRSAPTVRVGDAVEVTGAVAEFRPGNDATNLTTTQISTSAVAVRSSGNALPAPVVLGVDRVAPQQSVYAGDPGDVEALTQPLAPTTNALDFYESVEGMRVAVREARVVGPTASFGEIPVVPGQNVSALDSARGGVVYSGYDRPNAMRVQVDDALLPAGAMPQAKVRDRLAGDVIGVLDYSFANPKLLATAAPSVVDGGLTREVTAPAGAHELAVATFNVENLSMSNPQAKFDRLAAQISTNLRNPDVVALEEIQDDSGPADDGTVTSAKTVARLVAAISAQGGAPYAGLWIDPQDKTDGGQPGGNIRQVFLYRTDRGVAPAKRPAGAATTAVGVNWGWDLQPHLSVNPGRITPADPAWANSRKPLAAEFVVRGKSVVVIANHFASKGGDQPLMGRYQQPARTSETQRHAQAAAVRGFVDRLMQWNPLARVVVVGDINDFEFSRTTQILEGTRTAPLFSLPKTLPEPERYSYVYQGNSQILDQVLVSRGLLGLLGVDRGALAYDIVHTNAEFPDQDSDHDPQVARFDTRRWWW